MKKTQRLVTMILVFSILLAAPAISKSGAFFLTEAEVSDQKVKSHPLILSPEETLKAYLNSFIAKDIDTVMAYLPNGKTEQVKKWRERTKAFFLMRMTERKHIKGVIAVKLIKIEEQKNSKLAFLEAKIETSPKFSGTVNCDPNGKCVVTYRWAFRQYTGKGPWFFDGGGF